MPLLVTLLLISVAVLLVLQEGLKKTLREGCEKREAQIKAALLLLPSTPISVSVSDAPSEDYAAIMRRLNVLHDRMTYLYFDEKEGKEGKEGGKKKLMPSIGSFNWIGRADSPAMVKQSIAWLSTHVCSEGVAVLPVAALKVSLHVNCHSSNGWGTQF